MVSPPKNVTHSAVRCEVMSSVELSSRLHRLTRPKNERKTQGVKASEIEETEECSEGQMICCHDEVERKDNA